MQKTFSVAKKVVSKHNYFLPSLATYNILEKKARNNKQQILNKPKGKMNENNLGIHKKESNTVYC